MLNSTLNIFPELLTYNLAGPAILRIVLGFIFLNLGYLYFTKENSRLIGFFEIVKLKPARLFAKIHTLLNLIGGGLLIIGLYTQAVALVFAVMSLLEIIVEYREPVLLRRNIVFYILLFAISLSLIFTGAGFLALDLPL